MNRGLHPSCAPRGLLLPRMHSTPAGELPGAPHYRLLELALWGGPLPGLCANWPQPQLQGPWVWSLIPRDTVRR